MIIHGFIFHGICYMINLFSFMVFSTVHGTHACYDLFSHEFDDHGHAFNSRSHACPRSLHCVQAKDAAPADAPPSALPADLEESVDEVPSGEPLQESMVPSPTEPAASPAASPASCPAGLKSSTPTAAATEPKHAAEPVEHVPLQGGATLQINSTTHKREWQALNRVASGPRRLEFPEIARLFTGTKAEQRKVLAAYVNSGENLEEVESTFTIVRKHSQKMIGKRRLMTVAQMKAEGFSEYFAGIVVFLSLDCMCGC